MNTNIKYCSKCGEFKSIDEFYKNRSKKDGLQSFCKECKKIMDKKWNEDNEGYKKQHYQDNKQRYKEHNKQYREERKSHYLYMIYEGGQVVYIGSSSDVINRISGHISCNSNISDYMRLNQWTSIKFLNIEEYVHSKKEREFIENIFIEEICPYLNKIGANVGLDDTSREEVLSFVAYNLLDNIDELFTTYKILDVF